MKDWLTSSWSFFASCAALRISARVWTGEDEVLMFESVVGAGSSMLVMVIVGLSGLEADMFWSGGC